MKRFVPEDCARLVRLSSLAAAPDGALAYVKYFWQGGAWQRRVLLTEDGQLRLKGYTHTVDKYSLRQASTIQGVGLVWKIDF